jgi:hypothetical protein
VCTGLVRLRQPFWGPSVSNDCDSRHPALRHRAGCRSARGHDRSDRLGVRPAGEEEPLQRHRLLRRAVRQPALGPPRHHPARRPGLAGDVLDRRPAHRHVAAAGLLQDARVADLAAVPRPDRRGARSLRAHRRSAGRSAPGGCGGRGQARTRGFRGLVQRWEPAPGLPAGLHERHRPRPGVRAQHVASRADEARRVLHPGLAGVPPRAERRCGDRRVDRGPGSPTGSVPNRWSPGAS